MSAQQKRRRDVLFVLLGLVAFTFFLAVLTRSMPFIALQLVADVALAGYVYLLLQYKQRAQEQRSKVRYLGAAYREPAPYMNGRYGSASSDVERAPPRPPPADRVELTPRRCDPWSTRVRSLQRARRRAPSSRRSTGAREITLSRVASGDPFVRDGDPRRAPA